MQLAFNDVNDIKKNRVTKHIYATNALPSPKVFPLGSVRSSLNVKSSIDFNSTQMMSQTSSRMNILEDAVS